MEPTGTAVNLTRSIELICCVAAAFAGSLPYGHFFATAEYLPQVSAASLGGVVAAAIVSRLGWGFGRTLLVAVVGFLLLAVYGVFGETTEYGLPTRRTGVELAEGVVGGWARMLTVAVPADVRSDLLVTPLLITWAAAFTAARLSLRTRSAIAPSAPPAAAFVVALLFVGRQSGNQTTGVAVLLVAVLLLILLRADRPRRAMAGAFAFGVPTIAVIVSLGILAGQALPLASGDHRFDIRTLYQQPMQITDARSPLAALKVQLRENPPRRLFTVTVDGKPVDRIRTAALTEFDGVTWTAADRFLVAGHRLSVDSAMTHTRKVSVHVSVTGLPGPFLPVIGWPTRLHLAGDVRSQIGFSDTSGVLVTTRPSMQGIDYDLEAEVSDRDDDLPLALPSALPEYLRYRTLPDPPSGLLALAQQITASEPTAYGKLTAIERHLRGLPYQLNAPPGHSYATLTRMLTATLPHDDEGYAEQHASAFAVLARAAGFPARVAVGYRLHGTPTGEHLVTTNDAHAWAEVHFAGHGWIAFEPTDPATESTQRREPENPAPGPSQSNNPGVAPHRAEPPHPAADRPENGWVNVLRSAVVAVVLLLSLTIFVAVVVLAEKCRRRWYRRRKSGNSARVVGAWREAMDRLAEHGVRTPASLTAFEAAEHATEALGPAVGGIVVDLAEFATRAVYSADEPDSDAVRQAWALEARLRRQLFARLSLQWLMARLSPRPLVAGWRTARQHRRSFTVLETR
ncbi:transglutaminase-like putative cysteine protease [Kibdelosporangium banguiense]|uniref:Transglutaminase-like putative cysteine protease n=1 Tax=Kibdelosporangium banguiense TaxID=1365924 RepID=A0ABS4U041_9PSEU|nr:transglutaminaseTgpA domain-containing protein [Kibdelosporangium banguiense]MBP2329531.1 transglutaminase-like putative cysteine protease [Kibdelosporangium banguiense]